MGATLAESVNTLFTTINWSGIAEMLSTGLINIIDGITEWIQQTDWQAIGNDVAEFLGAIDWAGITAAISAGIGAALAGLGSLLWGLIQTEWDNTVTYWTTAVESAGGDVIQGLLNGLTDGVVGLGNWVDTNIVQPFLSTFKSLFGIASPSTVMAGLGGFVS